MLPFASSFWFGPSPWRGRPGTRVRKLDSPKNRDPGAAESIGGDGVLAGSLASKTFLFSSGLVIESPPSVGTGGIESMEDKVIPSSTVVFEGKPGSFA